MNELPTISRGKQCGSYLGTGLEHDMVYTSIDLPLVTYTVGYTFDVSMSSVTVQSNASL